MKRVALFFDGKNHMHDLRATSEDRWLDHGALADWMVRRVGGDELFGAFYYTGIPNPKDGLDERSALSDLLEELEGRPGFFVKRFNRRGAVRECGHCGESISYTEEKMVDTSLVADLLLYAMQDAYDIAVVFSGDLDLAPGLKGVQALGKQACIATFGGQSLSRSLRRVAWDTIDLSAHLAEFSYGGLSENFPSICGTSEEEIDNNMHRELSRAEEHFTLGGGFVGGHYFIHRWKGHGIPEAPELRRDSLDRLLREGRILQYTVDGKIALKTVSAVDASVEEPTEEASLPTGDLKIDAGEEDGASDTKNGAGAAMSPNS